MDPKVKEMCENYWKRLWIKKSADGKTIASAFYGGYISALEDLGMITKEDYSEVLSIPMKDM